MSILRFILPYLILYKEIFYKHLDLLVYLLSNERLSAEACSVFHSYFNDYCQENMFITEEISSESVPNFFIPINWNALFSSYITNQYMQFYSELMRYSYLQSTTMMDYLFVLLKNYYLLDYKELNLIYEENASLILQYMKQLLWIESIQPKIIVTPSNSNPFLSVSDDSTNKSSEPTSFITNSFLYDHHPLFSSSLFSFYSQLDSILQIQFKSMTKSQFYSFSQLMISIHQTSSNTFLSLFLEELKTGHCDPSIPLLLMNSICGMTLSTTSDQLSSILQTIIDCYFDLFQSVIIQKNELLCVLLFTFSYFLSLDPSYTEQVLPDIIYTLYEYRGSSIDIISCSASFAIQQLSKSLNYSSLSEFTIHNFDYIMNTSLLYMKNIYLHLSTPTILYYIWNDLYEYLKDSSQLQSLLQAIPSFLVYLQDTIEIYFEILSKNTRTMELISSILHSLLPMIHILLVLYDELVPQQTTTSCKTIEDCLSLMTTNATNTIDSQSTTQCECSYCHQSFSVAIQSSVSSLPLYCEHCLYQFNHVHLHYNQILSILNTNLFLYNGKLNDHESVQEELNGFKEKYKHHESETTPPKDGIYYPFYSMDREL